ncbi:MAG TPA: hypothetical protein VER58_12135 [Thermoanaerobaculia bacterium]|nr:hypothetical protein [Thermoanaerobaculia bacterium]
MSHAIDAKDLIGADEKLSTYKILVIVFIVVTPIIIAFKDPHNFLRTYRDFMLFAISWPLLALGVLYWFRRRYIIKLAEQGRVFRGTVKGLTYSASFKMRSIGWETAQVAIRADGEERIVDVNVARGTLRPDAQVDNLVEPKMRKGVVIAASRIL